MIIFLFSVVEIHAQSTKKRSLAGEWKVTWTDGTHNRELDKIVIFPAEKDLERYIDVPVPMDLNVAMEKRGLISDPNVGVNSLQARWVGQQYWCYYKTFEVDDDALSTRCWLVFDRLDYVAEIYLNGTKIGSHENAFMPCRIDVSDHLTEGINKLVVGIESGHYYAAQKPGLDYITPNFVEVANKRVWLRKPQYQYGWDWNPVMVNVGITGDVRLEWSDGVRIEEVIVQSELTDDLKSAQVNCKTYLQGTESGQKAQIKTTIVETNESIQSEVELQKDIMSYNSTVTIGNSKLWWPIGQGEQNFYHVKTEVFIDGTLAVSKTKRVGIRKVEID